MGLRERKREQTRGTIVEVAYRLFAERGYDATTVDDIAAGSDVSPRTFYRYFESKDGVLAEGGFAVHRRMLEILPPDPSIAALTTALAITLEEVATEDHFGTMIRLRREHPRVADRAPLWRQRWADDLAARLAAAAGREEPGFEDRVKSAVTVHVVSLAVDEWLSHRPGTPLTALVREAMTSLATDLHAQGDPART